MSDPQINIKQDGKDNKQDNTFNFGKKNEPIPSNVRAGSKNFVGREIELESIHTKLEAGQGVAICAVEGMGEIGKTELAIALSEKQQVGLEGVTAGDRFNANIEQISQGDRGSQVGARQVNVGNDASFTIKQTIN